MTPCPRHLQLAPVCPGLRPLRSGSSLRVPASSLPAASRFFLSPSGSADWVAESGALHYRALLSAQTVVGEPPHPTPRSRRGSCGPPSSALTKKCLPAGPADPPKWAPRTPTWGPRGAPKRGSRGAQNRGFRGSRGGPGGTPPTPPKMPKKWHFFGACGARTRGGGGAPPTTLILLRNQCAARVETRDPVPPPARPPSRPPRAPPRPRPPPSREPPRAPFAAPVPKGETTLASPCGSSGAAPRGVAWPGSAFRREPPCLRPAVGRPPPMLPPIACSCGVAP